MIDQQPDPGPEPEIANDTADHLLDPDRSACLCDVGQPAYLAATAIEADGDEHLVLVERNAIGDPTVRYDAACLGVAHEQLGQLPLEFIRRFTMSSRMPRCGRRTQAGAPCRIRVPVEGQACERHRTKVDG